MNHDEYREYLLGSLDAERRMALEEQMLCDPAVYEELLAIEEELIDEYVRRGGLTSSEQEQFETHFLITADRHKNLRFGKLLKRYMDSHAVFDPDRVAVRHNTGPLAPTGKTFHSFPSFSRGHAFAVSTLIAICLGVVVLWWLVIGKSSDSNMQSASRVVVVTLTPGSTQSAGVPQRVTMPPKGVDLKLELEVINTGYPNYKSKLFRESEAVQTDELKMEVKGAHNIVPITITGGNLSPGDYSVKLCGVSDSGTKEFIDSYSFRVTTE